MERIYCLNMSRPARKRTLRPLRNVSTTISQRSPRRLIWADTFRLRGIEVKNHYSWNRKSTGGERSIRISVRGILRLIQVDTLRRVHNVGFLAGRLNYYKPVHWKRYRLLFLNSVGSDHLVHHLFSLIRIDKNRHSLLKCLCKNYVNSVDIDQIDDKKPAGTFPMHWHIKYHVSN